MARTLRETTPLPPGSRRGVLAVSLTLLAVAVSYGALSAHAGFPWWQTVLLALLALGGAAELTFVGVIGAGGSPALAVLAGLLVNARNFAFGLSVGTFLRRTPARFLAAHLVNDESTAFARAMPDDRTRSRAFWVMGIAILLVWPAGALLGQIAGTTVDAAAFGLDAAFPVILLCLVLDDLRERATAAAAGIGSVLAVAATPVVPAGIGPIFALFGLVPVALWLRRARRTGLR